jgi:hypothetical protein
MGRHDGCLNQTVEASTTVIFAIEENGRQSFHVLEFSALSTSQTQLGWMERFS